MSSIPGMIRILAEDGHAFLCNDLARSLKKRVSVDIENEGSL
jgi:hypothetical protein